jgi:hypothetical protein
MDHPETVNEINEKLTTIESLYKQQLELYEVLRKMLANKEFVADHKQELRKLDMALEK